MMIKKIAFIMSLLSIITTTLPMMQQEREVVYAMHTIDKDFAEVGLVRDNVDMFISIFNINHDVLQVQLKKADKEIKQVAIKSIGMGGAAIVSAMLTQYASIFMGRSVNDSVTRSYLQAGLIACNGAFFGGLLMRFMVDDLRDAIHKRAALKEALATDKEILHKLEILKTTMMISQEDASIISED